MSQHTQTTKRDFPGSKPDNVPEVEGKSKVEETEINYLNPKSWVPGKSKMGIGVLGNANMVIKRKFRWSLEGYGFGFGCGSTEIDEHFVKLAERPSFNFVTYKADDKGTITTTHWDDQDKLIPIYNVATDFIGQDDINTCAGIKRWRKNLGNLKMRLYDGCGVVMESWEFKDVHIKSLNFGDLDYSSTSEPEVEITWGYDKCVYKNELPSFSRTLGQTTKDSPSFSNNTEISLCTRRATSINTRTI